MANNHPIKNYTYHDIEKYHKGLLSPTEMHQLEKAALEDPLLAEAIEGYKSVQTDAGADLTALKNQLSERISEKKSRTVVPFYKSTRWLRVAALVILLAGAGLVFYRVGLQNESNEIAQSSKSVNETPISTDRDSVKSEAASPITDSISTQGYTKIGNTNSNDNITNNSASPAKDNPTLNTQVPAATAPSSRDEMVNNTKDNKTVISGNKVVDSNVPGVQPAQAEGSIAMRTDSMEKNLAQVKGEMVKRKALESKEAENYSNYNTFRGRVIDANNNAVPFANVTNIDDNVGTYADARGYFNLTSPDSILTVQVRGLGYNNRNLQLRNDIPNNPVVLREDKSLTAVVLSNKKPNASSRSVKNNMKLEGEPEPMDGWDNYDSYLANNLNIPEDLEKKNTGNMGEVKLSFEVNNAGEPVNIRVEKSLCGRCDQEAIRLIKQGPKWKRNARKSRTTVTVSF